MKEEDSRTLSLVDTALYFVANCNGIFDPLMFFYVTRSGRGWRNIGRSVRSFSDVVFRRRAMTRTGPCPPDPEAPAER